MNNDLVCIDIYTVSEGDTLYSIGEKYDLPVPLLMKVNLIADPYNLQVGSRLIIPGDTSQLPDAEIYTRPKKPQNKHTIKAGDTLYLIAKNHNIKLDALMNANPNVDPYNLEIGSILILPN